MNESLLLLLGYGLALTLLFFLLMWAHLAYWRRKLSTEVPYDEMHKVMLPSGSFCELRRLKAPGPTELPPVLMVHGIAINHRNLDPRTDVSLARAVRDAGHDVWLLTLRSGRWDLTAAEKRKLDFAALSHEDIPAGVEFVLKATGHKHLDYLGFSMGGMLAYASLGVTVPLNVFRRVVIMGSPGFVGALLPGTKAAAWLGHYWKPTVPGRLLNGLFAFVAEIAQSPIQHVFLNPHNSQKGLLHAFMIDATADIPGPLAMNMVHWAAKDGKVMLGDVPVLEGLKNVHLPVLFVVGGADKLGTPKALRAAYEAWGGPKKWIMLSKEEGYSANYGHMDMVTAPKAPEEVFAPIIQFLGEKP